jgi:competence ComEA-like helix-hairpin-helix protein
MLFSLNFMVKRVDIYFMKHYQFFSIVFLLKAYCKHITLIVRREVMKKAHGLALVVAVLFAFTVAPVLAQQAEQPAKPATAEKAAKPAKPAKPALTGKININTATADQIAMLPGVGPKKAQGLVDYRSKNGNFKNIEDLQKVPGIKQKKIDKVKDYLIFDGETTLKAAK